MKKTQQYGLCCPECGSKKHSVSETRSNPDGCYRRRVCEKCGNRFSTQEYTSDRFDQILAEVSQKFVLNWVDGFMTFLKKSFPAQETLALVRKAYDRLREIEND